ncbi:hypothetical protein ACQ4PT_029291 [Festuca glaucescens]
MYCYTRKKRTLIGDLEETFANLRKVNIKLNPAKCAFGVPSGKLLGFLVSHRGIEANPDKVKAIEEMQPLRNLKEMQCLAGCMAALGRFIARSGEKALPFFKLMKRTGKFKWTLEAAKAFDELKRYLTIPPIMVAPRTREPLLMKLRHYFQGHPIIVVTSYPLEQVLRNPNVAGRVAEWVVELQPFELTFETTKVIKSKVLAEFTAEWTDPYAGKPHEEESMLPGALCFKSDCKVSNNIAEYEGLLAGLKAASALGIKHIVVKGDSQLIINFSNKSYTPKDEHMMAYLEEHRKMEKLFLGMELRHVPRGENQEADDIARRASHRLPQRPGVFEERLMKPSAAPLATSEEPLDEEPPPPPATGDPNCGPPSGDRIILALTRQEEVD